MSRIWTPDKRLLLPNNGQWVNGGGSLSTAAKSLVVGYQAGGSSVQHGDIVRISITGGVAPIQSTHAGALIEAATVGSAPANTLAGGTGWTFNEVNEYLAYVDSLRGNTKVLRRVLTENGDFEAVIHWLASTEMSAGQSFYRAYMYRATRTQSGYGQHKLDRVCRTSPNGGSVYSDDGESDMYTKNWAGDWQISVCPSAGDGQEGYAQGTGWFAYDDAWWLREQIGVMSTQGNADGYELERWSKQGAGGSVGTWNSFGTGWPNYEDTNGQARTKNSAYGWARWVWQNYIGNAVENGAPSAPTLTVLMDDLCIAIAGSGTPVRAYLHDQSALSGNHNREICEVVAVSPGNYADVRVNRGARSNGAARITVCNGITGDTSLGTYDFSLTGT